MACYYCSFPKLCDNETLETAGRDKEVGVMGEFHMNEEQDPGEQPGWGCRKCIMSKALASKLCIKCCFLPLIYWYESDSKENHMKPVMPTGTQYGVT